MSTWRTTTISRNCKRGPCCRPGLSHLVPALLSRLPRAWGSHAHHPEVGKQACSKACFSPTAVVPRMDAKSNYKFGDVTLVVNGLSAAELASPMSSCPCSGTHCMEAGDARNSGSQTLLPKGELSSPPPGPVATSCTWCMQSEAVGNQTAKREGATVSH